MGAVKFSFNECYGLLLPSHYKYISKFITKSMKLVVIKKNYVKNYLMAIQTRTITSDSSKAV